MRWIVHLAALIIINAIGLWAAATYIPGFNLSADIGQLLYLAAVFTVINLILKPILKLILGPIIVLTLGLGLIIINALMLVILDAISNQLTIETIPALLCATILIGVLNFFFHVATSK
jgi:putative membrane protein